MGMCLSVAQWLYNFGDVNIHAENEHAFRWACSNDHLSAAQWLYNFGDINIHAKNDYGFLFACSRYHLSGVQWLCSLGVISTEVLQKCLSTIIIIRIPLKIRIIIIIVGWIGLHSIYSP
jgi:hypothetical protein